jgi:hypothetical protein
MSSQRARLLTAYHSFVIHQTAVKEQSALGIVIAKEHDKHFV